MKLLYLHQYFTFPDGNSGTRSYDLAQSFVRSGINVEIITTSSNINNIDFKSGWNIIEKEGLKLHVLKLDYKNEFSFLKRKLIFLKFVLHTIYKLMQLDGDLLLATSTPLTIGIPALVKKKLYKMPYIFEVRDVWPEVVIAIGAIKGKFTQKLLFYLEKVIYRNAAAIVPLSIDMKQSIINRFPKLEDNILINVIENIAEIGRFQNAVMRSDSWIENNINFRPRFSILYAGTFGKVNAIKYVLDLAVKLKNYDPSIVFLLVGSGAEKAKLKETAEVLGVLNSNVFFLNPVAKHELPDIYKEVNMGSSFVANIPNLWANSANKFFDTLAAGKPILINHYGWQGDVINNKNVGFILPPVLDDQSIKKFVSYTYMYELHNNQMDNALALAKEQYSLEISTIKYLKIFECVIKSKKKS